MCNLATFIIHRYVKSSSLHLKYIIIQVRALQSSGYRKPTTQLSQYNKHIVSYYFNQTHAFPKVKLLFKHKQLLNCSANIVAINCLLKINHVWCYKQIFNIDNYTRIICILRNLYGYLLSKCFGDYKQLSVKFRTQYIINYYY